MPAKADKTEILEDLPVPQVFDAPDLLKPPVRRAAYSDRTAWLMAALSELAYYRFEGDTAGMDGLIADIVMLAAGGNTAEIRSRIASFVEMMGKPEADRKEALRATLKLAGFELDGVYNKADTQAFLAHRPAQEGGDGMRVLIFRGTEKDMGDVWTDLDATLVKASGAEGEEEVHRGFQRAFEVIRDDLVRDLAKSSDLPLYIGGHSLGGALAVVATWFIASNSLGACYTFGGPRVGNLPMARRFKTPIYRVVNASDYVPRVPPAVVPLLVFGLRAFLSWIPLPLGWLVTFLDRFAGYVHFGDMRYLRYADPEAGGGYKNVELISNPSVLVRGGWVVRRWVTTRGRGGAIDHSIATYRKKLRSIAIDRNA